MTAISTEELPPGTLVLCRYRFPSVLQPWIHEFPVGIIEVAGTDPTAWNGHTSEQDYCRITNTLRVCYVDAVQHEARDSLFAITPEQVALSHREKIALFLGDEALRNYDRGGYSGTYAARGRISAQARAKLLDLGATIDDSSWAGKDHGWYRILHPALAYGPRILGFHIGSDTFSECDTGSESSGLYGYLLWWNECGSFPPYVPRGI